MSDFRIESDKIAEVSHVGKSPSSLDIRGLISSGNCIIQSRHQEFQDYSVMFESLDRYRRNNEWWRRYFKISKQCGVAGGS